MTGSNRRIVIGGEGGQGVRRQQIFWPRQPLKRAKRRFISRTLASNKGVFPGFRPDRNRTYRFPQVSNCPFNCRPERTSTGAFAGIHEREKYHIV